MKFRVANTESKSRGTGSPIIKVDSDLCYRKITTLVQKKPEKVRTHYSKGVQLHKDSQMAYVEYKHL